MEASPKRGPKLDAWPAEREERHYFKEAMEKSAPATLMGKIPTRLKVDCGSLIDSIRNLL
jgi:hypothetical protein